MCIYIYLYRCALDCGGLSLGCLEREGRLLLVYTNK